MKTRIIILAQGQQSRLPHLGYSKCLLPLEGCGSVPLIYRTLVQLLRLTRECSITVVGWLPLLEKLQQMPIQIPLPGLPVASHEPMNWYPQVDSLPDPGNSSLKGVAAYLADKSRWIGFDQTVILLGDVLYSWGCLEKLLPPEPTGLPVFCGTSNLSNGGGELWGLSWDTTANVAMSVALDLAMTMHPPFAEYQPGQMRRWLFAYDKRSAEDVAQRPWFAPIDDYTMDVDLPHHIAELVKRSFVAGADDELHGVIW